jgi:hypothetical protein
MLVAFQLVTVAVVPLNVTVPCVGPKFVPVIFIDIPTGPEVEDRLVITGAAIVVIVSVRVALPVPLAFVALSVTVDVPAVVGVPEINPVVPLNDNPAGSPVAP